MQILIGIGLVAILLVFFIITTILNAKVECDENLEGFTGNCKTCGVTSCTFHPTKKEGEEDANNIN